MAIPNQALEKLVREIENKAAAAQQQIALTRSQMTSKQREMRILRLTLDEISELSPNTAMYEGVGKMFISVPVSNLQTHLETQLKENSSEVDKLSNRLVYLETTHRNSMEHIEKILTAGKAG